MYADATCPASGAHALGRVVELTQQGAKLAFEQPPEGFDIGATVDCVFTSEVLRGSQAVRGRVKRIRGAALELLFESQATTPLESLFNRRTSLRIGVDDLGMERDVELVLGTQAAITAKLEDLSMSGVAIAMPAGEATPRPSDQVRLRLTGPTGLTVWLSGSIRHVSLSEDRVRLGIEFDRRMAATQGASPGLRELVRQLERAQLDKLILAHAGIAPDQR